MSPRRTPKPTPQPKTYADPIQWEDEALAPYLPRRQTTAWRAVIKGIYGSPLTEAELAIWRILSGGIDPPKGGHSRVLLIFGRRAGKTDAAGLITAFEATQREHQNYLGLKQVGLCAVLAQDLARAQEAINASKSYLTAQGDRKHVRRDGVEHVVLKSGLRVEKLTASEQGVRGPTIVTCIGDELANWDKTGPGEDERVMSALLPALTIEDDAPPRRFIGITSAGHKQGFAWRIFRDHFGKASQPWLVLRGSTYDLRPSLESEREQHVAECAGRPGAYEREYLSLWSDETAEAYFPAAIVQPCVRATNPYIQYQEGVHYAIAVDPAYKRDEFAIAIACSVNERIPGDPAHARRRITSLVHVESLKPSKDQSLSAPIAAFRIAQLAERYNVTKIYSDQHDPEALKQALRPHRLTLVPRYWHQSSKPSDPQKHNQTKTERFSAVREAMLSESLILPNDEDLLRELSQIVAEPQTNGLKIYGTGRHDDRAHAAVLAISEALMGSPSVATKSLHPAERYQREEAELRLMYAFAFGGGW